MGMFDTVYYKGEQYQTKDTPAQSLDNYKIEIDQTSGHHYLWHEEYDVEWIEDKEAWLGSRQHTWNHRWVCCDDFDGLVRFYREDRERGGYKNDAWIEYKALFMDGVMIKLIEDKE